MRDTVTQRNASALPNWEATSFGAVADFINGYAFKPSDWFKFGLPIIRIAQMLNADTATDHYEGELPNAYRIDDGDLLFSWSATLATVMWTRGPAWLNQHLFKVVPKAGNSARFLHHLIDFHIESLAAQSHGTTMRHIKRGDLLSYPVLRPNPTEQSRIAAVLDTVDEAIAKTEAVIAKLKQVRTGLLHDLLTRGLDEHGHLRDPISHPEQFQHSSLGQIPRDWEIKTCQNVCREIVVGIVVKPAQYYVEEGVPVLRSANVREEGIQMTDLVFISDESNALLSKSIIRTGDVVTVRTGYPGTSCVVPPHLDGANCVDLIISRPSAEIVPAFLALWINSPFGRGQVLRVQGGLAQQHFNVGELKTLLIAKPDKDEQARIVERIATLDSRISLELETRTKLSLLKSGLMTDLLTGRVRVPELEDGRRCG